jgi:transposase
MGSVTIYSGARRRRDWSDEEKLALVQAAFAPGAIVSAVARRVDVAPSQIYRWRQQLSASGFAPVVMTTVSRDGFAPSFPPSVAEVSPLGPVLIVEAGDARVQVMRDAPVDLVKAALSALRR